MDRLKPIFSQVPADIDDAEEERILVEVLGMDAERAQQYMAIKRGADGGHTAAVATKADLNAQAEEVTAATTGSIAA